MNPITLIIPEACSVIDIARLAAANKLHIISDGENILLSSAVPAGYHRMGAGCRCNAANEGQACAA